MSDGIEAGPSPAKKTLTGHSPLPVNLYCATPPQVGQPDRGGDELTKAGNARWASLGSHHLPDDAGDPEQDADRNIFSSSAFLSPARPWLKP